MEETDDYDTVMNNMLPGVKVEGVVLSRVFERGANRPMEEQIECIRAMEMRHDDVFLCAYMKCGTHWLWEIASMLLAGKAEYEKRAKEHMMLEGADIDSMKTLPSPRVFNTHLPFSMLPNEVKVKKIKILFIYRNVKDVFVSKYLNMRRLPNADKFTWQHFERMFFSDECPFGTYFEYHRKMDAVMKDNPDVPFFKISYEEMKEDPVAAVERLNEFLETGADPQLCKEIADACSFQKMKEAEKSKIQIPFIAALPPQFQPVMYRKGEVGDWKNYLTVARSERLDSAITQLESCDYHFRYTL